MFLRRKKNPTNVYHCINNACNCINSPLCDREVAGSIPGRVILKTLKMVQAALSLGAQHLGSRARTGQLSVGMM